MKSISTSPMLRPRLRLSGRWVRRLLYVSSSENRLLFWSGVLVVLAAMITLGCGGDGASSDEASNGASETGQPPAGGGEDATAGQVSGELAAHRNRIKAHFENGETDEALAEVERALRLSDGAFIDRLNEAKVLFLAQRLEEAIPKFQELQQERPERPDIPYNLGIIYKRQGDAAAAIPYLERVVELEPRTIEAWFNLAVLYQRVDRREDSMRCIDKVLEFDPYHAAAYYQRSSLLRAERRMDEAKAAIERFSVLRERLASEDLSSESLEESHYFEMGLRDPGDTADVDGSASESGAGSSGSSGADAMITFVDATADLSGSITNPPANWTAEQDAIDVELGDLDGDGHLDIAVLHRKAPLVLVLWNQGDGGFSAQELTAGLTADSPRDLVLFDLDNDADLDIFALGAVERGQAASTDGNLYLISDGHRGFTAHAARPSEDVAKTGLPVRHRALPADYDHDGDLDLILSDPGVTVLRNTGSPDSTVLPSFFEDTAAARLDAVSARLGYVGDLDLDADLDLLGLSTGGEPHPSLLGLANVGRQEYETRATVGLSIPTNEVMANEEMGLLGALIETGDFDNDSWSDALVATAGGAELLINEGRLEFSTHGIDGLTGVCAMHAFDADNDGDLDLFVTREDDSAEIHPGFWLNSGEGTFLDRSAQAQLAHLRLARPLQRLEDPSAVAWRLASADLEGDGDLDVLMATSQGLKLFRNEGGTGLGHLLELALDGGKSNHFGFGATVEVAASGFFLQRTVESAPVAIGVGAHETIDYIRFAWPSGIVQNEVDVRIVGQHASLNVEEKKEALGSCPALFARTGEGMQFVTDVLATTSIGLVLDGVNPMPFDDEELILLPEPAAKNGRFEFTLSDELDEVIYFDHAELWAVDHPPEWTLYSNTILREPPFPPADIVAVENERAPQRAWTHRGNDVTAELADSDGRYAADFDSYGEGFHGLSRPHTLTLDLGEMIDRDRLVLVIDAWMDWPETATFIAIAQNPQLELILPRIYAAASPDSGPLALETTQATPGRLVHAGFGVQALKPKPLVVDLRGLLQKGERYLHIEMNLDTYWNRISIAEQVDEAVVEAQVTRHRVHPIEADLYYRGHSTLQHPDDSPLGLYHPDRVDLAPPWQGSSGAFTRYGDVTPLLQEWDDQYAILNTGDAVDFAFPAGAVPNAARESRTWFLRIGGFDKQGDYGTLASGAVEPLPFRAMTTYPYDGSQQYPSSPAHLEYRAQYNTRIVKDEPRQRPLARRESRP